MEIEKNDNCRDGIFFAGFWQGGGPKYPAWRYHKFKPEMIVENTDQDEAAQAEGYEEIDAPVTANPGFSNWYWDIEDMSARQLVVYARDEYGVDLPIEAGQIKLQKAVFELAKAAPENRDRIVMMAHSVKMNYDETQEEIRRHIQNAKEETREEFYA